MPSSGMLCRVAPVRANVSRNVASQSCHTVFLHSARQSLVTFVSSSSILVTLMMEVLCSSEKSVLTRAMHNAFVQLGAVFKIIKQKCVTLLVRVYSFSGYSTVSTGFADSCKYYRSLLFLIITQSFHPAKYMSPHL
jgi:hypothetical protein